VGSKEHPKDWASCHYYCFTGITRWLIACLWHCSLEEFPVQFRVRVWTPLQTFSTYTIRWNADQIIWFIDGRPLRVLDFTEPMPWPELSPCAPRYG